MRCIDADALIADCQLAQKQANRHGREFANAFYSGGGEISTEWWCVEDMIDAQQTIEPERKIGKWVRALDGNDGHVRCNKCFKIYDWDTQAQYYDFCPKCGAKMGEGEQE